MQSLKFKLTKYDSMNPYLKEGNILTFPEGNSHYLTLAAPGGQGTVTIQAKNLELVNGKASKEPENNEVSQKNAPTATEGTTEVVRNDEAGISSLRSSEGEQAQIKREPAPNNADPAPNQS